MKKVLLILIFPLYALTINGQNDPKRLVWAEEFAYEGLPDPLKWKFEEGLIRNREAQYYTNAREENAMVKDGLLTITARKEEFKGAHYTSASINTRGLFEFTYGRIEVRAKLPEGLGTWPAIWTLGTNIGKVGWPACGEIDIMEFVGFEPDKVYANVHTANYNHTKGTGRGSSIKANRPFDDFHVYAVEWYEDHMDFFYDDSLYFTCRRLGEGVGEWPFFEPQYLLINLAIGGAWGGTKGIDDAIFPVTYQIDYVRVYSLVD